MLARLLAHWITGARAVARAFPAAGLERVEAGIAEGEKRHAGEVCVVVEPSLPLLAVWSRVSPRQRALEVFSMHRVWDTEQNCGVLLYLLLADRDVEVVADRGIHRRVGEAKWQEICRRMEEQFRAGRFVEGVERGVAEINELLAMHFPVGPDDANELANRPVILG